MVEAVFAIPGDLATPTGGYGYDRRLLDLLPREGIAIHPLPLPGSYPDPTASDLEETARLLAGTPAESVLLIDGLALGAMPADLVAGIGRRIAALVHHPLALESGLAPERQAALLASEQKALALARRVVVTSPLTARLLAADYGVPPERITVAEPGTEPAPRARGTGHPLRMLAVGAISPRKGYDLLIEALSGLRDRPWHLTLTGAADRHPEAAARLRAAVAAAGLEDRVGLAGSVSDDALAAFYAEADLFVSPSLYEGYGMVLAEAMARGLPVVASTGGAAAETVPDGAALKVPPGDGPALRAALARALDEPGLRACLAEASWAAGQRLPRWPQTAARVARVLKEAAR